MLTRIFVGLWHKKKADMLADDLRKLAKVFNIPKDLILLMKSRSVKRGTEGGHCIDLCAWRGGRLGEGELFPRSISSELQSFFEKAKKYALGIVFIISPSAALTTS
jgi:hypothetical protein